MATDDQPLVSESQLRVIQFLVGVLIMGPVLFGVALLSLQNQPAIAGPARETFLLVFAVFAVCALVASFGVPRAFMSVQRRVLARSQADAAADPGWPGRYQTQILVAMAPLEGAAFFGLVLYLITGDLLPVAIAAAFVAIMLLRFPTRSRVEGWILRQQELLEMERAAY